MTLSLSSGHVWSADPWANGQVQSYRFKVGYHYLDFRFGSPNNSLELSQFTLNWLMVYSVWQKQCKDRKVRNENQLRFHDNQHLNWSTSPMDGHTKPAGPRISSLISIHSKKPYKSRCNVDRRRNARFCQFWIDLEWAFGYDRPSNRDSIV